MSIDQHAEFNPAFVVLSFGISFIGAYLSASICEQLRMSLIEDKNIYGTHITVSHRKKHLLHLLLMTISFGGVGVWGMHFVGMHAFTLKNNGHEVHIMYNAPLMATSFLAVIVATFIGMLISCYDPMFSKSKLEIIEEFIENSKSLSFKEIRKITYRQILVIITTKELGHLLWGGLIMGAGITIAHYVGMMSLVFDGHMDWKAGFVVGSVLVAMLASMLGFWIVFRLLSIFPEQELLRLGSSVVFAIAATGMHYIGMLAVHYKFEVNRHELVANHVLQHHVKEGEAFVDILVSSVALMWAMAIMIMWNSRSTILRQAKIIHQADKILYKIAADVTAISVSVQTATSSSSNQAPNVLRNMIEQYVTKRCRTYAVQRRSKVSGTEGSITLEREQQRNMGFLEYALHIFILFATCQWYKLWLAVSLEADSSVGGTSQHSDASEDRNGYRADDVEQQREGDGLEEREGGVSGSAMMEMAEMLWTTRKSQNHDSTNSGGSRLDRNSRYGPTRTVVTTAISTSSEALATVPSSNDAPALVTTSSSADL